MSLMIFSFHVYFANGENQGEIQAFYVSLPDLKESSNTAFKCALSRGVLKLQVSVRRHNPHESRIRDVKREYQKENKDGRGSRRVEERKIRRKKKKNKDNHRWKNTLSRLQL